MAGFFFVQNTFSRAGPYSHSRVAFDEQYWKCLTPQRLKRAFDLETLLADSTCRPYCACKASNVNEWKKVYGLMNDSMKTMNEACVDSWNMTCSWRHWILLFLLLLILLFLFILLCWPTLEHWAVWAGVCVILVYVCVCVCMEA